MTIMQKHIKSNTVREVHWLKVLIVINSGTKLQNAFLNNYCYTKLQMHYNKRNKCKRTIWDTETLQI